MKTGLRSNHPIKTLSCMESLPIKPFGFSKHSTPASQTPRPRFRKYINDAWHVVEPTTPFVGGYHVDAIAEHLEAITRGDLQNLIINIPPRHSKSSLVCVLWPTWEWIDAPSLRWLFATYGQDLTIRDSVKRRRLIDSPWYREQWGDRYQLTADQNQKTRYETDKTGVMISTSVGGQGTGEGGSRIVVDDPHKADEIESDSKRQAVLDWWDSTIATRADQPMSVARVIIMQRLHEADLVGHVLQVAKDGGEQWDHLILPAEYEPRVQVCLAGLEHDRRTEEGELLSDERFPSDVLNRIKVTLGDRAPGQLQQRPSPPGGAIYRRECWADGRNRYDPRDPSLVSKIVARWLSYDTAFKDGEANDFTGLTVFDVLSDFRLLVRWVEMRKLEFPDLVGTVEEDARRWNYDGKLQAVVIEDAGSGISLVQTLIKGSDQRLAERVIAHRPKGSKPMRARAMALWCNLDMVLMPIPCEDVPWVHDFIGPDPGGRLFRFPNLEHDDDVDSFTQGLWELEPHLKQGYEARLGVKAA
jgi:phage terminase large subunit-like protein